MKARTFILLALIVSLTLVLTAAVTAKEPPDGGASEKGPALSLSAPLGANSVEGVSAPAVPLGQPGLSFRYVQTFGVTETPYFSDTTHINRPWGLFIDGSDNLYVVEEKGYRLLRYSPAGVNTLALGKAGVCYTDNDVFCAPQDIALDGSGNIWVADGQRVVQYDADGVFLQQQPATDPWASGNDNERFENVHGIAFDGAGRMYVSDTDNHRVQVYTFSSGSPVYSTTIGVTDTPGSDNSHFNSPYRLAIDGSDRLYVVDRGNNRVQRCTFSGDWNCTTFDSGLNDPQGIAIDSSDNVYIADTANGRIRKCSSVGVCNDFVTDTYWLYDVSVDSGGNVYGAAAYETIVVRYNSSGELLGAFVGVEGVPYLTDNYHYNVPRIAIDKSNNLIVVEETGQRLLKLDANGTPLWAAGVPGVDAGDNAHFNYPHGVAVDNSGRIYVADGCRVQIYTGGGIYSTTLGTGCGTDNYQFDWVAGIAVGDNGYIYVSDANNHRVQIYNSNRVLVGRIGVTGECGSDNDHLCQPIGIEVDASGYIYVADAGNARVQKFNSNRQWKMTLGTTGSWGEDFSQFSSPEDIAIDAQGRIYVADIWNNRVQVFDPGGAYLATIGGAWGSQSSQWRNASGVDVDSVGNVYVADLNNGRIQKFAPGVPGWRQMNINGFGERWNGGVDALEVFNGQLYAESTNYGSGTRIWRTPDGMTWTAVTSPGFGSAYTNTNALVFDVIEFSGQLYAATGNWGDDGVPAQIWRSPDGTAWTQVEGNGFGNANNFGILTLGIFSNTLYAATFNTADGLEIWRSSDGLSWTAVVTNGFGGGSTYRTATSLIVFHGDLYAAVEAVPGSGAQVWRSNTGNSGDWIQVNLGGFGDTDNYQTGSFAILGGYLYVSTRNDTTGAQLWRSSNGTTWTQAMGDGFGDSNNHKIESLFAFDGYLYAGTANYTTGIEIWRSSDGTTWKQVNVDGFGDSNNEVTLLSSATATFNNCLFMGTSNWANGGEVWQFVGYPVYLPLVLRNAGAYESLTLPLAPGCELYNPTLCGARDSGGARHGRFVVGDIPVVEESRGHEALQLFLSYDISSIPAQSQVLGVSVDLTEAHVAGSPFDTLGCLTIYAYDYGTVDATTYLTGTPGTAIAEYCSEQDLRSQTSSSEAVTIMQEKLGGPHFQVRFQFEQGTDHDDDFDWVDVESHPPDVIVYYRRP